MSADNPSGSSGDADQPADAPLADGQPDQAPRPEQAAVSADTGQLGSNRSRAEYAATLRSTGWDAQPQSPPDGPENRQGADAETSKPDLAPAPDGEWPDADRDRWHAMYQEWRDETTPGWERGTNIVGEKPDRSPGDTSDLPPSGEQLVEVESKESRFEALHNKICEPEVIEGLNDIAENEPDTVQALFERPPTSSHTEVPSSQQQWGSVTPEHASASEIAAAGLVTGVLLFETARWTRHKLETLKGR
jgi:hypothetical protein